MSSARTLGAACSVVAAGLLAGCTDGGTSLIILQNTRPSAGCVIEADEGASFIPRGRIDVNAFEGYLFTPLVQSTARGTSQDGQRIMFVEGADVNVSFAAGFFSDSEIAGFEESGLSAFSEAFSGSIAPQGFSTFAFTVVPKPLLDIMGEKLGDGASTQVVAEVVVFGELDGGSVESQPFSYPIDVCDGCMLVDNGLCSELASDFEPRTGGVCNTLQDVPVNCCIDAGGGAVCPAEPAA